MKSYVFDTSSHRAADSDRLSRRRLLWCGGAMALSPLALALAGCGGGSDGSDGVLGEEPALPPGSPPTASCSGWSTAIKVLFINTVSVVGDAGLPGVGTFSAGVLDALWPSCGTAAPNDVLSRADVVNITHQTYATTALSDVKVAVTQYRDSLANHPDASDADKQGYFETCYDAIVAKDADYQPAGDEVALLPMFALYGHLFLSVAVDGQINAAKWGYDANSLYAQGASDFLKRAIPYVNQICEWSIMSKIGASDIGSVNYHGCEPFRSSNTERTRLYTDVLDIVAQWPDVAQLGTGTGANGDDGKGMLSQREVFYGPYGTGDESGLITLPMQSATASPVSLACNSGLRLDAVQATYTAGTGPDGVTTTPKMGDGGGGPTTVARADTIVGCTVWSGDIVNGIRFNYAAGDTTSLLGGTGGTQQDVTPSDSLLSSVYVNGVSTSYGSADAFVVGFRLDPAKFGIS